MPIIFDDDQLEQEKLDLERALQKKIGNELMRHYPGQPWGVYVSYDSGLVQVSLAGLLKDGWGFTHRIDLLEQMSAEGFDKEIMRIGGELLELFNIRRGGINENEMLDAITNCGNVDSALPAAAVPPSYKETEAAIELASHVVAQVIGETVNVG